MENGSGFFKFYIMQSKLYEELLSSNTGVVWESSWRELWDQFGLNRKLFLTIILCTYLRNSIE